MKLLSLSRWQWTTMATLTIGYAGYYFCRSNLSIAAPLLLNEFPETLDKARLGSIASVAVFFYAGGKFINGVLGDFLGGRRMFLFGMLASIGATVIFGLSSGFALFMAVWCFNRFVQSMGWGALVKTASRWFPAHLIGTILAILSLSYLFGDVVARLFLGRLVSLGFDWRTIFFASAGVLAVICAATFFLLKSSPAEVGEEEPAANAANLFGETGNAPRPQSIGELLLPFFTSFPFCLVCMLNFGLTLIRETFNFWTPTYLTEFVGMTKGDAGMASALFPLFGGISVLASGMISDSFLAGRRCVVIILFLLPAGGALIGLANLGDSSSAWLPLILISTVGLCILGPYSFMSGALSVDFGGKRGSATAAGLSDTVGYIGGIVSGRYIGSVAQEQGWSAAMSFLAYILAATVCVAVVYWFVHERRLPRVVAPS